MLRIARRFLAWARLWPPPAPDRLALLPQVEMLARWVEIERLALFLQTCTWCGLSGCDSWTPDTGRPIHLDVRPYCQRQREALAAHGRRT